MTTPNFGWPLIQPTDFVTDLPADFETFADAVDADLAGLNGGTTGQVLAKDSGTDYDFSWVTPAAPTSHTLLGTISLGTNPHSFTSISQDYRDLYLVIENWQPATNGAELLIRVEGDTGTNYVFLYNGSDIGTAAFNAAYDNFGSWNMTYNIAPSNLSSDYSLAMTIYDYKNTAADRRMHASAYYRKGGQTNYVIQNVLGYYKDAGTAIDEINITLSSGNFTTGTVNLYGVN